MSDREKHIFCKKYSAEELCDVDRDISECFDPDFNPKMKGTPEDSGSFVVTVEWRSDDWCSCTGFQHHPRCKHHVVCF